jgi:hypothetical protein
MTDYKQLNRDYCRYNDDDTESCHVTYSVIDKKGRYWDASGTSYGDHIIWETLTVGRIEFYNSKAITRLLNKYHRGWEQDVDYCNVP